jgi:hypothetical protein
MWCTDERPRASRCAESFDDCNSVLDPASEINSNQSGPSDFIVPEGYDITLRPGVPLPLSIDITTVRNVPLDLYILFDLSQSLSQEFGATRDVSSQILDNLRNITNDVQVGLGGFIDKTVRPFSRRTVESECPDMLDRSPGICYNFRHFGPLTTNPDELNERVVLAESLIAANIDAPEAGLDALGQIALCDDEVGWRENSLKIVLYFTDDAFHFAGEGRFAGIMRPFEDVCKLKGDFTRDDFLEYDGLENDFISLGHMLSLLEGADINPVFVAVTSQTQLDGFYDVLKTHQALAELLNIQLSGRASAAQLDSNTTTDIVAQRVLAIIDERALEIIRQTRLAPSLLDGLSFTVEADCPEGAALAGNGTAMQSCTMVGVGNTTEFTLTLMLDDCDDFGTEPQTMDVAVRPVGSVSIRITPICECNCDDNEVNSDRCSGNGNYSCGECICNEGYCGLQCQFLLANQNECPRGEAFGDELCSGPERGTCLTCECICSANITNEVDDDRLARPGVDPGTFGGACECDYFSCLSLANESHTEVCTGRGTCCNEMCMCDPNFDGYLYRVDPQLTLPQSERYPNCDCEPAEVVCRPPDTDGEICGGRGTCECSTCTCDFPYTGRYCDEVVDIIDCGSLVADDEAGVCVLDEKNRRGQDRETCQTCVTSLVNVSCVVIIPESEQPTVTDTTETETAIEEFASQELTGDFQFVNLCTFTDGDICLHVYYILYNKTDINRFIFIAEEQRTCPSPEPLIGIPLWALAIILLVLLLILGAILLIIIKVIFMLLDYFEVKRLEREVGLADFSKNQNPLYQSPDVEYKNVAYGKE